MLSMVVIETIGDYAFGFGPYASYAPCNSATHTLYVPEIMDPDVYSARKGICTVVPYGAPTAMPTVSSIRITITFLS
jgi:hypothetical protein